jgi:hypothetical protein
MEWGEVTTLLLLLVWRGFPETREESSWTLFESDMESGLMGMQLESDILAK